MDKLGEKYGTSAGVIAIIISSLLWGIEFVVAKDILGAVPPNWSNAIRFFIATVIACIVWRKHFKNLSAADWVRGAVSGSFFGVAVGLYIMGLEMINVGVSGFLSAAYIIIIPFIVWIIERKRPASKIFAAAIIGLTGVTVMSVDGMASGNLTVGAGELLTLLSAFFYGLAFIAADYYSEKSGVEFITACQMIFSLLFAVIFALILDEPLEMEMNMLVAAEFVYSIVFGTFFAQWLLTYGTRYASANQAGVILPLESVTAVVLGCIFLNEQLLIEHIIGGILIIAAVIICSVTFKKTEETL